MVTEVDKYQVSEKLKKTAKPEWWTTAVTIAYLKRMAGSHQPHWQKQYDAAKKYLSLQIGDTQAEEEILKVSDQLVVEKVTKKAVIDKAAQSEETQKAILDEVQTKTTIETTTTIIEEQKEDGSIGLSEVVAKELDVSSSETLVAEVDKYQVSEKLKKTAKPEWWTTAVTIAYLKRMAGSHQPHWQEKYDAAKKYLTLQIGDAQAEEEILKVSDQLVVEKITRKAVTAVAVEKEKGPSIFEQISRGISDTTSTVAHGISEAAAQSGDIAKKVVKGTAEGVLVVGGAAAVATVYGVEEIKDKATSGATIVEEDIQKGVATGSDTAKKIGGWISGLWGSKDKQEEALKEIETKTTVETTTTIIEEQKEDGSIGLSKAIAEELDISSSETWLLKLINIKLARNSRRLQSPNGGQPQLQ